MVNMKRVYVLSLVIGLGLLQAIPARADTENDFQQWSLIFVNHHLDNNWSASMQVENRLRDDASEVDKQIFKPGGYYAFTDSLKLGVGYKYVKKKDSKDEQDPWQELFYNPAPIGEWDWAHQFCWEQRTGGGLDGVVHRLRYLLHVTHPLGDSGKYYFAAQDAVRFNAASNDTGPVDGFEQSRLYTADWVVDLGPEGGSGGGQIIATGTPEDVAKAKGSFTGQVLGPMLKRKSRKKAAWVISRILTASIF